MKYTFTLLFLFMACFSFGQLSYTQANHASGNYNQQMTLVTIGINSFDFDTTGANFTWDYSALGMDATGNSSSVTAASSGYQAAFITQCLLNGGGLTCLTRWNTLTNMGLVDLDSLDALIFTLYDVMTMARLGNNRLIGNVKGLKIKDSTNTTIPIVAEYSSPDTILTFPFTYQTTGQSFGSWGLDLNSLGQNIVYKITYDRDWTVEGWGTLITPFMTHNNVLKVKTTLDQVDSVNYLGTAFGIPRKIVEYTWYDATYGLPVMKAEGLEVLGTTSITTVRYYDQRFASLPEESENLKVDLYPNPATDFISIASKVPITNYQLLDAQGKVIATDSYHQHISVANLESGVYLIRLVSGNEVVGVKKFVKE